MDNLIWRALAWVTLLLVLFVAPWRSPGRRRARPEAPARSAPVPEAAPPMPRPRADDSGFLAPLVGEDHDLVRPYIALYERQQERQREERHMRALRIPLVDAAAEAAR